MGEKLFGNEYYYHNHSDTQSEMLKTIRIPKNLLYLTDRLPKPSYEDSASKKAHASSVIIKSKKQHATIEDREDLRSETKQPKKLLQQSHEEHLSQIRESSREATKQNHRSLSKHDDENTPLTQRGVKKLKV